MANFELFQAENDKMVCRGGSKKCIGFNHSVHKHRKQIPKDTKVLSVSVYGAGGGQTTYYCEVCMMDVLERVQKIIDQLKP